MTYRITVESTADLPAAYYAEHGVTCIGMGYTDGTTLYREGSEGALEPVDFYNSMRSGVCYTTQQISPYEFREAVEPLLQAGEDILHLAFSSHLSGSYQSAVMASEELREQYPDRKIIVVNTLAASRGQGLLVDYVVNNRDAGMSLEDNAAWLEAHKLNMCHWFTVDDLVYLQRGGRVSKLTAVFGGMLGIKPVMHCDNDGALTLVTKRRGRRASIDALVEQLVEHGTPDIASQRIYICHGDCEADAAYLAGKITEKTGATDIQIYYTGAVIGSHSGPGTLAVFFMGDER